MLGSIAAVPSARLLLRWLVLRAILSPCAASAFAYRGGGSGLRGAVSIPHNNGKRRLRAPSRVLREGAGAEPSPPPPPPPATSAVAVAAATRPLTAADVAHMRRAASLARAGRGSTFPNPAVGCVLVRHDGDGGGDGVVVGSGFHPRAGMPHAEVFALLEACGHVGDGVGAARSVMTDDGDDGGHPDGSLASAVSDLLGRYMSEGGTAALFGGAFAGSDVTAYVTLEPCCHHGRTPPCASSLVAAGVGRVVVGCRDPNPRVDGGGIGVLEGAGIEVRVLGGGAGGGVEADAAEECRDLIRYFAKRISPRPGGGPARDLDDVVDGRRRRALRSVAGRMKNDGTIQQIQWPGGAKKILLAEDDDDGDSARRVPIDVKFLEAVDGSLWDHELVLLRLNNAVRKKSGARILSGRVAEVLDAHVAQVIGHTALLYRPAIPPVLDLDELARRMDAGGGPASG